MKVLILTDKSERHYFFCNEIIHSTKNVVGIVTGGKEIFQPKGSSILKKLRKGHFIKMFKKYFFDTLFFNYGRAFNKEKELLAK